MTDDERKVWEELVKETKRMEGSENSDREETAAILAADEELNRLRETVEWACGDGAEHYMATKRWMFRSELRSRASGGGAGDGR